jgi:hypothetical protein
VPRAKLGQPEELMTELLVILGTVLAAVIIWMAREIPE